MIKHEKFILTYFFIYSKPSKKVIILKVKKKYELKYLMDNTLTFSRYNLRREKYFELFKSQVFQKF